MCAMDSFSVRRDGSVDRSRDIAVSMSVIPAAYSRSLLTGTKNGHAK